MKKLNRIALVSLLACATLSYSFAQEADAPAEESAAETKQTKKKRPRKKPEYRLWSEASSVAEAWEQPVVAFIGIQGDKVTSRFRMMTVANPAFKEMLLDNAVCYTYMIPQVEAKKGRRGQRVKKDAPAKPDLTKIKDTERVVVATLASDGAILPMLAILDSNRKELAVCSFDPEDQSLASLVDQVRSAFESGQFKLEVPRKVEKLLKEEAKKRAAEAKRRKK